MTPLQLATELKVSDKTVRRILRKHFGTLERQNRGPRWALKRAEADYVRQVVASKRRG